MILLSCTLLVLSTEYRPHDFFYSDMTVRSQSILVGEEGNAHPTPPINTSTLKKIFTIIF